MDIARLSRVRFGVLTEAPKDGTPNPEELVDQFMTEESDKGNIQEDVDNEPAQPETQPATDQSNDNATDNNQNQDPPNQPDNASDGEDNYYDMNGQDSAPADGGDLGTDPNNPSDSGTMDVPDNYDVKDEMPKLKILQSISDKEYKLNNIHCHEQFKELYTNVDNFINNYIMNLVTKNEKQSQIVTYVHNNLSKMLDDLNTYICYKFNDIYEDNILAYTTFLKRYHVAAKIIKTIDTENRSEAYKNNKLFNH